MWERKDFNMNAIKMYIYKIFHSQSSLIILLAAVAMSSFSIFMVKYETDYYKEHPEELVQTEEEMNKSNTEELNFGIMVDTPVSNDDVQPTMMEYVTADLTSGMLLIFLTIFVVLFVNSEESSGFIKNIIGQPKRRGILVESKAVAICVYNFILMGVYTLAHCIGVKIAYRDAKLGWNKEIAVFFAVMYLLMAAFGIFIACITILVRNNAMGIVLGLIDACGIGYLFTNTVNRILDKENFDLNRYMVVGRINGMNVGDAGSVMVKAAIVAVIWFAIWLAVSEIVTAKRDIRGGM